MGTSNRKKLFIVRRESGGIGGAEKVAHRFVNAFSQHFDTELIHAGKVIEGKRIRGTKGPSWVKCLRFAKSVMQFLDNQPNALILSMERGVPGDIYRAGDGVHSVWRKHKFGQSPSWVLNPLHWLLPRLERISVEQSTFIISNSNMIHNEISEHYNVGGNRMKVIQNGYDSDIFYPLDIDDRKTLRDKLGLIDDNINLLFSGSGWGRKGLEIALLIVSRINNLGKTAKLWVAGKGKVRKFRKLAYECGVGDKVTFLGGVNQINQWYQACDIMVLPTMYDPFSNSCLEALASGTPVVTTIHNGAKECLPFDQSHKLMKDFSENEIKRIAQILASDEGSVRIPVGTTYGYSQSEEIKHYLSVLD